MRKIILTLTILLSFIINAQNPVGAWERIHTSKNGKELKSIVIFSESHQSISIYESKTGRHVHSNGGTWELKGKTMTEVVEFDTDNPERVGSAVVYDFSIDDVQERAQKLVYKYLDTTTTYKLKSGLFKIEDSMSLKSDENEKHTLVRERF